MAELLNDTPDSDAGDDTIESGHGISLVGFGVEPEVQDVTEVQEPEAPVVEPPETPKAEAKPAKKRARDKPIPLGYERVLLKVDYADRKAGQTIDVLPRRRKAMVERGEAEYQEVNGDDNG